MTQTTEQQARDYVERAGLAEARRSNHYLTAKRHCQCGVCFCCWVRRTVEDQEVLMRRRKGEA